MRAKDLVTNVALLVEMCKPTPGVGWCLDGHGLPLDARVERVDYCFNADELQVTLVSEEWDDVPDGATRPIVEPPRFRRIPQPGWTDPASEL